MVTTFVWLSNVSCWNIASNTGDLAVSMNLLHSSDWSQHFIVTSKDSAQYHRKFRAQTSHTPVLKHHLITIPPSAFNLSIEIVQIRPNGDPGLNTNPFLKPVRVFIFFKFLSEIHKWCSCFYFHNVQRNWQRTILGRWAPVASTPSGEITVKLPDLMNCPFFLVRHQCYTRKCNCPSCVYINLQM